MQVFKRLFALFLLPLVMSCAAAPDLTKEESAMLKGPSTPQPVDSLYSEALSNMGIMIQTYGRKTSLQAKEIKNKTACKDSLPVDITDMLKTALNTIGDSVQIQVYDPNYDLFNYGQEILKSGAVNVLKDRSPSKIVEGAITECDEKLDALSNSVKGFVTVGGGNSTTDLDAGLEKKSEYTKIGLDLRLIDFKTNRLLPKKQTAMSVDVHTLEKGGNFSFSLYGSGLSIDGRRRVTQGKHNAVRALVELSTLQLIGRDLELPYWRCIPGATPDPIVTELWKSDFRQIQHTEQVITIKSLLTKFGYRLSSDGNYDTSAQQAVHDYRTRYVKGSSTINEELYVDLMTSVPLSFEMNGIAPPPALPGPPQVLSVPKSPPPGDVLSTPKTPPTGITFQKFGIFVRPEGKGEMRPIRENDTLTSGDHYKMVFQADRSCYVYIFQIDSSGKIYQMHPMQSFKETPVNSKNPIIGGIPHVLPGNDKAFVLDNVTGKETIYFMAFPERNMEVERLYEAVRSGKESGKGREAEKQLQQNLSLRRGIKSIVEDKPLAVPWKETGDVFMTMNSKLASMCGDCAHFIQFTHN